MNSSQMYTLALIIQRYLTLHLCDWPIGTKFSRDINLSISPPTQHCLFLSFSLPVSFSLVLSFMRFFHTHETPRFACKPTAPLTLVLHITPSGPQLKTIKQCWNFLLSIPACVKANKSPGSTVHPSFRFCLKALSAGFLIWVIFGRNTGWCFGNLRSLLVRMLAFLCGEV